VFNVLDIGYPANAETNPATPRNDVAIGLITGCKVRHTCQAAREDSTGQPGLAGPAGHCGRYPGIPPPPRGLPPPLRPYLQHFSAGMPGGGTPGGSGWKAGAGWSDSNGAALRSPAPLVSADMPTPAAVAAAEGQGLTFTCVCLPRHHHAGY
jgi:hypothetical protein